MSDKTNVDMHSHFIKKKQAAPDNIITNSGMYYLFFEMKQSKTKNHSIEKSDYFFVTINKI